MDGRADGEIRALLRGARDGETQAVEALLPLVYSELRRLAGALIRQERAGHTLQPTALVHEAYLRLVQGSAVSWSDRAHFLALAAKAMRQVLVDHARARGAAKRDGGTVRLGVEDVGDESSLPDLDLLALDSALEALRSEDERCCRVVELRFFGGLSVAETAHVLGTSSRTVEADWTFARAWLHRRMKG